MTKSPRATVLFSGGIDSTACIHLLKTKGFAVQGLFIDYGQSAACREREAVLDLSHHFGIQVDFVELKSSLHTSAGEIIGRNSFLLSTALMLNSTQPGLVVIGIHSGTPYYDCSSSFITTFIELFKLQTDGKTTLTAPFLTWSKAEVYGYFSDASLPLDRTYSCEAGQLDGCGNCLSCLDRVRYHAS